MTISKTWRSLVALSCASVLLGCLDESTGNSAEQAPAVVAADTISVPEGTNLADVPVEKPITPPANLSPGVSELVKLAQSGVGEEVMLAYVKNPDQPIHPSVDEIVYLKDLGLSEPVLAAIIGQPNADLSPAAASTTQATTTQSVATPTPTTPNVSDYTEQPAPTSQAVTAPLVPQQSSYAEPAQPVDVGYFQDSLSPYGTWVTLPEYGACWQPTVVVVDRSWRPYSDRGRWVYTSCGWYWQSDYSWGWAPFHYGRWYCDNRVGWVWIPGSTWGPAWVSWRYTDAYCGWAPLPPSARFDGFGFRFHNTHVGIGFDFGLRADFYTFIPTSHFCDRNPSRYYASSHSRTTIYKNSFVINNYIRGNNNTVINEGIGKDRVAKASRTQIRTVALRDLPSNHNPIGRADHFQGNSLEVFRPNVAKTSGSSRLRSLEKVPATPVIHPSVQTTQDSREASRTQTRFERNRSQVTRSESAVPSAPVQSGNGPAIRSENPTRVTRTPAQTETQRSIPNRLQQSQASETRTAPLAPPQAPVVTAPQTPRRVPQREMSSPTIPQREIRELPMRGQQNFQNAPSAVAPQQPVRREVPDDSSLPRSLRSLPQERSVQAPASAPQIDRGSQLQRTLPRSIQQQPQQQQGSPRANSQQQSAPRQQSAQPSRSERSGRDRDH